MESLIEVQNLKKCYNPKQKPRRYAVNGVSLKIDKGESVGLVGESGCGKSTLAKCVLQLEHINDGKIFFHGQNITNLRGRQIKLVRRQTQMVFQSSYNALDPYLDVRQILMEPVRNYGIATGQEAEVLLKGTLEKVKLSEYYLDRYPNELSGGQCQRVGIARALITRPEFVACDEAVSSLDYAIRNRILDLLLQLKGDYDLTYLFISHDLSAVKRLCDRVIVMYMGEIVEIVSSFCEGKIRHPYTKALLAATLGTDPRDRTKSNVLLKKKEDLCAPAEGCVLQNRCLYATARCCNEKPTLKSDNAIDYVACHFA